MSTEATTTPAEIQRRLTAARLSTAERGWSGLLVTTGADLRYLTGYDAHLTERITALVVRPDAEPVLIAPELEASLASRSPAAHLGVDVRGWAETENPYAMIATLLESGQIAVSDRTWAQHLFGLQAAGRADLVSAAEAMAQLRMTKSPAELAALRAAAEAIDRVHARVPDLLRVGRTERAVSDDLAAAILQEGHESVDFTIVGSGPNGASPHHSFSDRVIGQGDLVVVDIGGTTPAGYHSDSTRTYCMGPATDRQRAMYAVLQHAQEAAVLAVRPGVSAGDIDAAARDVISAAGYGDRFIHRTGHGIGLEGHEHPYLVEGNDLQVTAGMCFSIEPGIYFGGEFGARIEDIVAVIEDGVERLNRTPRELVELPV